MPKKDCSELAKNLTQIALNIGSREHIRGIDDIVTEMRQHFPEIRRQDIVDAIVEATTGEKKQADDLSTKLNRIKQEARQDARLQQRIDTLQEYIDTGTLPPEQLRPNQTPESQAIADLKAIKADLEQQIRNSPAAKAERIRQSIKDLQDRLDKGDILPTPKPKEIPQTKELQRLEYERDMLRQNIRQMIHDLKPQTIGGRIGQLADGLRLLMTTGEFSFGLRQGGLYAASHPIKWAQAMGDAFRAFSDPQKAYQITRDILNRENAPLYARSKLPMLTEGMQLTKAEESIMNYWQDKLPVVKNFNRAAIAFFNRMRADLFDLGYETLGKSRTMTDAEAEVWSNYISVMTGRGKLGKAEQATLPLNRAFFAIRYVASRFQMLTGQPAWHNMGADAGRARAMVAKEYLRIGLGLTAIYALAKLSGADIETDPRSSDAGKLRFGNTRIDPLSGMQQPLVFLTRMITGQTKDYEGEIKYLYGEEKDYGARDVQDVIGQFGRSKLSPAFGLITNIIFRETFMGEPLTFENTLLPMAYPITYGDMYKIMQQEGIPQDVAMTVLALLGMGVQVYDE